MDKQMRDLLTAIPDDALPWVYAFAAFLHAIESANKETANDKL